MVIRLKTKFVLWCLAMIAGVLVLGGVSVWNLVGLRRAARAAAAEYDAMDRADAVSVQVAWLRDVLREPGGETYNDAGYFAPIRTEIEVMVRELRSAAAEDEDDGGALLDVGKATANHLDAALRHGATDGTGAPSAPPGGAGARDVKAAAGANSAADDLEQVRQSLAAVSRLVPGTARRHVTAASDRLLHRIAWSCVWLLIVLILSVVIHVSQYRALVRPLLWLRDDMKRSSGRDYRELAPKEPAVRARGGREFKDVAAYFNGLARELAELYRGLEEKVIARSRELVRSERLASVGFLAAGVAHEINNPLGVISGYAELATKGIDRVLSGGGPDGEELDADARAQAEAEALANALEAQTVIRDEAFRCKEITSRLLSLARGGGDGRQPLRLDEVAKQVSVLTKGLKNYRDRRVVVEFEEGCSLEVVANPTEMKQVLLNLTVNGLEAVPPQRGEVKLGGRRLEGWVEVYVQDNGKGMSAETLAQVFEPFFTAKRGTAEPGTGLGLSITHAIVENHGGRIRAESDGPGHGSRFIIRLPARGYGPERAGERAPEKAPERTANRTPAAASPATTGAAGAGMALAGRA